MRIKRGFTLVEILIVVAIIALLAAIAIPNLVRARVASNDAMAKSTLKSISTALESYLVVNSNYPTATSLLLGVSPPYLNKDYFVGTHSGFTFGSNLGEYSYTITATPIAIHSTGSTTFTMETGGVLKGE